VIDPAKEFYNQYTTAVVLYDAKQLPNGEQKVAELRKNLDALQLRLQALMLKPPSRS